MGWKDVTLCLKTFFDVPATGEKDDRSKAKMVQNLYDGEGFVCGKISQESPDVMGGRSKYLDQLIKPVRR